MKLVSKEEQDAQQRATIIGGAKGFVGGSLVALPLSYALHKRWSYYRHLPPSLKALGVILVVVPSFVISAEHAGQAFERSQWRGAGAEELENERRKQEEKWKNMGVGQRIAEFARTHEYGMILSGWAASMAASFGIIARNPYQTMPQKIVQARMWAQGLTVGVLIAAAVMTHSRSNRDEEDGVRHIESDHSWRDIIEHQEEEKAAAAKTSTGR